MSMGTSERDRLIRESQQIARSLLEKLKKQSAAARPEDKAVATSPNAPKRKSTDRDTAVPTSKSVTPDDKLAVGFLDKIEAALAKGDPAQSQIQPGLDLTVYQKKASELEGTNLHTGDKLTISKLFPDGQAGTPQDKKIAFYVEPHAARDVKVGSKPGEDVPDVPITVAVVRKAKLGPT